MGIKTKALKFVIFSPPEFVSGGALVLHLLCNLLNERGYSAKIFLSGVAVKGNSSMSAFWLRWIYMTNLYRIKRAIFKIYRLFGAEINSNRFKAYSNEKLNCPIKYTPFVSSNTIVVYPEIVEGNPLKGKKIVRWILYHPGGHTGRSLLNNDELKFYYQKAFIEESYNLHKIFTLNYINIDLCKQTNFNERKGNCYIIRKGSKRDDLPQSFDGPIIDKMSDEEIANVFNQKKYCISYDTMTFYTIFAAACGCIPIIVPIQGISKDKWQPNKEYRYGRAYGDTPEDIEFAIKTRNALLETIANIENSNNENINYFLNECIKYFNTK